MSRKELIIKQIMGTRNSLKNRGDISVSVFFLCFIFFLLCCLDAAAATEKLDRRALVLLEDEGPGFCDAVLTPSAN